MGWYGKGNFGDEALLYCIENEIYKFFPNANLHVFCADSRNVSCNISTKLYDRTPLNNFLMKFRLVSKADIFVIGGGTMLCDNNSFKINISAISSLMFWPIIGKCFKAPCMAYAQGLGPAVNLTIRLAIKYLYSKFDAVALRDNLSTTLYRKIAKNNDNVCTTCDPVVNTEYFDPCYLSKAGFKNNNGLSLMENRPYTLVSIRKYLRNEEENNKKFINKLCKSINILIKHSNTDIVLFPAQKSQNDVIDEIMNELIQRNLIHLGISERKIHKASWKSLEEASIIIQSSKLVISNRLHSLLIAAKAGVAITGIVHQDKIKGCLEMIGLNKSCQYIYQDNYEIEKATKILTEAWDNAEFNKPKIKRGMKEWGQTSPSNIRILQELLWRT